MTLVQFYRDHYPNMLTEADTSYKLFQAMCSRTPCAVPGCSTDIRLAYRMHVRGFTAQEAAAREYVYRWGLVLRDAGDPNYADGPTITARSYAPHSIGLDGVCE